MRQFHLILPFLALLALQSCGEDGAPAPSSGNWLLPEDKIVVGAERDQIPSIDDPQFTVAREVSYLNPFDRVIGIKIGDEVKAYPIKILNYHELINDWVGDTPIVVTYCPLTATSLTFVRQVDGVTTEFGSSGLLYNSNLIMYDRETETLWNQVQRRGVFGEHAGRTLSLVNTVEMEWQYWAQLYPESETLNYTTGFQFSYNIYPYRGYRTTDDFFLFPVDSFSDDFPSKQIMKGSIANEIAYLINDATEFQENQLPNVQGTNITFIELPLIKSSIVTSGSTDAGRVPELTPLSDIEGEAVMQDATGNKYSVFGEVVEGPFEGDQLKSRSAFSGFWFIWDIFFPVNVVF